MRKIKNGILSLIILSFILSSCYGILQKIETEVNLKPNEHWKLKTVVHIPANYMNDDFIQFTDEDIQELEELDVAFDVDVSDLNEEGNYQVTYLFSGQGFAVLNEEILGYPAVSVDAEEEVLYFNLPLYYSDLGDLFSYAAEAEFTLNGGKILETNGKRVDDYTVIWANPDNTLEASMEIPTNDTLASILIGGGFILLAVSGYKLSQFQSLPQLNKFSGSQPTPTINTMEMENVEKKSKSVEGKVCGKCGESIPKEAVFCPECGSQQ